LSAILRPIRSAATDAPDGRANGTYASREGALLLACARLQLDPARATSVRQLASEPLDWDVVLALADAHRLTPLLHRHLSDVAAGVAPERVLRTLREHNVSNAAHSLRLAAELLDVLAALAAHGIPALPFKGPVLAQRAYDTLAVRQMGDLDVLVRRRDVVRARELLLELDYRSSLSRIAVPGALRFEYQHCLEHARDGIIVELHWTISPRSVAVAPLLDELWERREIVPLLGSDVPSMGGNDLLLALCIHGSKHRWRRLEWITCVAELLARWESGDSLDWDRLIAGATRLGNVRMLWLGLALANDPLGAPLPDAVLRAVRADPYVRTLATYVRERMFPRIASDGERSSIGLHGFRLRAKERLADRIRYVCYSPMISAVRFTGELAGRLGAWSES
jgi:hypothetical protein